MEIQMRSKNDVQSDIDAVNAEIKEVEMSILQPLKHKKALLRDEINAIIRTESKAKAQEAARIQAELETSIIQSYIKHKSRDTVVAELGLPIQRVSRTLNKYKVDRDIGDLIYADNHLWAAAMYERGLDFGEYAELEYYAVVNYVGFGTHYYFLEGKTQQAREIELKHQINKHGIAAKQQMIAQSVKGDPIVPPAPKKQKKAAPQPAPSNDEEFADDIFDLEEFDDLEAFNDLEEVDDLEEMEDEAETITDEERKNPSQRVKAAPKKGLSVSGN